MVKLVIKGKVIELISVLHLSLGKSFVIYAVQQQEQCSH